MAVDYLKKKVLAGFDISKEEAMGLWDQELSALTEAANELRRYFCGDRFDLCTIVNGKSGACSENCKYCAQSSHFDGESDCYPLLAGEEFLRDACRQEEQGVLRYSVVTSGKKLSEEDTRKMAENYRMLRQRCGISLCASHGLLDVQQLKMLAESGVARYHNNLETSRRYFPEVCTTHTYDEKIATIKAAQEAGLDVCSGGIIGMGETREDRVDLACAVRELGVVSVPLNVLNPIPGTPFEDLEVLSEAEVCRTAAVFRFILPGTMIRLAGGRGLFADKGKQIFCSGANAAITGDMLTTSGITVKQDYQILKELGYEVYL